MFQEGLLLSMILSMSEHMVLPFLFSKQTQSQENICSSSSRVHETKKNALSMREFLFQKWRSRFLAKKKPYKKNELVAAALIEKQRNINEHISGFISKWTIKAPTDDTTTKCIIVVTQNLLGSQKNSRNFGRILQNLNFFADLSIV